MPKLLSIDKYLKKTDNSLLYIGKSPLYAYVPEYFKNRNFLIIEKEVELLGIMKLSLNGFENTLIFPTMIKMVPSKIELENDYYKLTFNPNDIFIRNTKLIQDSSILYKLFTTFITLGKIPTFVSYENIPYIFDYAQILSGTSLNSRRTVFELIFGELIRDEKDLFKRYRNSPMTGNYKAVSMHNLIHVGKSVSAKLLGGYFRDGLVASTLIEPEEEQASPLETLIRI